MFLRAHFAFSKKGIKHYRRKIPQTDPPPLCGFIETPISFFFNFCHFSVYSHDAKMSLKSCFLEKKNEGFTTFYSAYRQLIENDTYQDFSFFITKWVKKNEGSMRHIALLLWNSSLFVELKE